MKRRTPLIVEEILEPELPIVDPHHHLWDLAQRLAAFARSEHPFVEMLLENPRYLLDELLVDLQSGHNIRATIYMECGSMYRADGKSSMRCIGETEFVNGIAAMFASGTYGHFRACAGIVGKVDLMLGAAAEEVIIAQIAAGGGRFRGIRNASAYDADPKVLGPIGTDLKEGLLLDKNFRDGFKYLVKHGLSYDAWLLEPQLPDVIDLARAFSDTTIVLNHVGTPLGIGRYKGKLGERFGIWRDNLRELAKCQNTYVKLGGLAMPYNGFRKHMAEPFPSSQKLAEEWKPYVETCIEVFGASRCMFESNFPVDNFGSDYPTLWNAFKRLAANCSSEEKRMLFSQTACDVYRIEISPSS